MGVVWELVSSPIGLNIIKVILWVYRLQAIECFYARCMAMGQTQSLALLR